MMSLTQTIRDVLGAVERLLQRKFAGWILAITVLLSFVVGGVWVKANLWPVSLANTTVDTFRFLDQSNFNRRFLTALPSEHEGDGVVTHDAELAYPGYTLLSGIFPEGVGVRLIDMTGETVHVWPVEFSEIFPKPTHLPANFIPRYRFGYTVHGQTALPDGSVVVNMETLGTVKLNRCGDVVWTIPERTHHFVKPVGDGTFWIGGHGDHTSVSSDIAWPTVDPSQTTYPWEYENTLLLVSADGEILREVSVLRGVLEAANWQELFQVMENDQPPEDPLHLNNMEIVTPKLAARLEGVEAGDLLVSLRNVDMLAILDQNNGDVVWYQIGPWTRQHDPDILPDGRISVFDNRDHKSNYYNKTFGPSQILTLTPETGEVDVSYPLDDDGFFYTRYMGVHQHLPNGNMLITESTQGRVIEATVDGDIVWELVEPFDDTYAALIAGAERIEYDFFDVADWSDCST